MLVPRCSSLKERRGRVGGRQLEVPVIRLQPKLKPMEMHFIILVGESWLLDNFSRDLLEEEVSPLALYLDTSAASRKP